MASLGYPLQTANLDGFTDSKQFPVGDFVGIGQLMVDLDGTLIHGEASIGLSTLEDANLMRLAYLVNQMANLLIPGKSKITIYDAVTGVPISSVFITGRTRIAPPVDTETQPLQPVMFTFQTA